MVSVANAREMAKRNVGLFKRVRASVCKHCPACNHARKSLGMGEASVTGRRAR
jgi:hypothetical protein